jgi:hypothetical protein
MYYAIWSIDIILGAMYIDQLQFATLLWTYIDLDMQHGFGILIHFKLMSSKYII